MLQPVANTVSKVGNSALRALAPH